MKQLLGTLLFFFSYTAAYAQSDCCNAEIEKASPFANTAVHLKTSWVKEREELNTIYLESLNPDRLLHNFRVNAGIPSDAAPLEGWEAPYIGLRGHFTGHYLSAASSLIERDRNIKLTGTVNYMVDELYKCQQVFGNGYLSAFPEADFDRLETHPESVWAPYYTYNKIMQGLLDVYTRTGNKKAYEMVVRMADYVEQRMAVLDEATIEKVLYSVGANPTNEAGAMNEVLHQLYSLSKDPRHLPLAKLFDRDWLAVPLSENKNILSGLHANTHLVLVNGFTQRYANTREELYREASVNFWNMLINEHAYVNGSSSGPRPNVVTPTSLSAEHWGVPGRLSHTMTKEIGESCVTHNTQKLTSALFTWSANPVYADVYMNTFYNAVLALQSARTGACVYHLPLGSPRNKIFLNENDFRCCNGSSIEAFARLNSGIYYQNKSDVWVNLYVPSQVNWQQKGVILEQTGDFPHDYTVEFTVSTKKKTEFALHLLIPSWAKQTDIYVNGEKVQEQTTPVSYFSINREWKNKDRIKLVFHPGFHIQTMPDDDNVVAIYYGPVLLAFEHASELILKGNHQEILKNLSFEDNRTFYLQDNGQKYTLRPLFEIENQAYGVYATIRKH